MGAGDLPADRAPPGAPVVLNAATALPSASGSNRFAPLPASVLPVSGGELAVRVPATPAVFAAESGLAPLDLKLRDVGAGSSPSAKPSAPLDEPQLGFVTGSLAVADLPPGPIGLVAPLVPPSAAEGAEWAEASEPAPLLMMTVPELSGMVPASTLSASPLADAPALVAATAARTPGESTPTSARRPADVPPAVAASLPPVPAPELFSAPISAPAGASPSAPAGASPSAPAGASPSAPAGASINAPAGASINAPAGAGPKPLAAAVSARPAISPPGLAQSAPAMPASDPRQAPVATASAPRPHAPALAGIPRAVPQSLPPGAGADAAAAGYAFDIHSRLLTRIEGRTAGKLDFRQTPSGLSVRLGSLAEVLGDRLAPAMRERIRASSASNAYLSLADLQQQGIPISYDPVYDEFNIGTRDTRPRGAAKVHMHQISTPERGLGSTGIAQVPRRR